uniref:Uncharacterized protein n=1 Tax=Panagrolaimus sp. PS1159 TaxID=55785 RepID=A0AC35GFH6_9BILA
MSEFHAKPLTDEPPTSSTPSTRVSQNSKGIKQVVMAPCFPPMYPTPYPPMICRSPSNAPFCSSHNFFGFLLFSIVSACVFIPIIAVHATVYLLPENNDLYNNLIPGFNLTKMQLIGIIVFVSADIILYGIVYFIANYSTIFYGCSTEMSYKTFTGTQFIPVILIIKLLQPLTVISEQDKNVDELFIWSIRFLLCLFIFASIIPLIFAEVRLFRCITGSTSTNCYDSYNFSPLIQNKCKTSAYLFFGLKLTLLFCFVLEMAVINFGIISPMSIDYPLIISAANLIFIFYSHQPVIVKYNVIENGRTAITSEFGCLDGRRCCNKYRPNKLLAFERIETSFIQAATCEYTFYSVNELPKWLQYKIAKIQKKAFNPKIGKY